MNSELRKAKILNPLDTLEDWMNEVSDSNTQPNPNGMSIATVDSNGSPNSRMV
jgi:Pyridoxamine-phosphate oxidase